MAAAIMGSLEAPSENGWMARGHGLIHRQDLISYRAFMLPTTESLFTLSIRLVAKARHLLCNMIR